MNLFYCPNCKTWYHNFNEYATCNDCGCDMIKASINSKY